MKKNKTTVKSLKSKASKLSKALMKRKKNSKKVIVKPTAAEKRVAPTLKISNEQDIAYDFAQKVYKRIGTPIKSIVLFGSSAKGASAPKSDIDIIILLDDATIAWDDVLIAWYREELAKVIRMNPYVKPLHVNTVRITTWWNEMMRGEPVVINVIRWGLPLIDFGGFFAPLKALLAQGKIRCTPEMIYITLGRAPTHLARAKINMLNALEAVYWSFVDSSHSALIASEVSPPSPEHIPSLLRSELVDKKLLKGKYVDWYTELYNLTHKVMRGELTDISGNEIQIWRERADEFIREMAIVVKKIKGRI